MPPLETASPPHKPTPGDGSLLDSPHNSIASDCEFIFMNPNLDMAALIVYEGHFPKPHPSISLSFALTIIIRKKAKFGSRHFKGKHKYRSYFSTNSDGLCDIPIISTFDSQVLRACMPTSHEP